MINVNLKAIMKDRKRFYKYMKKKEIRVQTTSNLLSSKPKFCSNNEKLIYLNLLSRKVDYLKILLNNTVSSFSLSRLFMSNSP